MSRNLDSDASMRRNLDFFVCMHSNLDTGVRMRRNLVFVVCMRRNLDFFVRIRSTGNLDSVLHIRILTLVSA